MLIEKYTDPRAAIRDGVKRYFGKECSKHPDLLGERNAKSRCCLGCARERIAAKRWNDPDYYARVERVAYKKHYVKHRDLILRKSRHKRTGMDDNLFRSLLAFQGGVCAICHKPLGKSPHADHSHDTGTPRGLLCGHCNRAEGMIRKSGLDPQEFGKRFSMYLTFPPAQPYLGIPKP